MNYLETGNFREFIENLAARSGRSYLDVLRDQTGAVLDICIARSPNPWKQGRAKVRRAIELRIQKPGRYIGDSGTLVNDIGRVPRPTPDSTLQTTTGTRGAKGGAEFEWYVGRDRKGKRIFLPPDRMLGNEKFHRRQGIKYALYEMAQPKVMQAMETVGSVKASWVAIADEVGAPLRKAPKWVKKVRSKMQVNDGALSRVIIEDAATFIEVVNTNVMLINKYNGGAILQGAIQTRMKAFEIEVKKGVFNDIAMLAKRYPGIFTTS